ncbi:protein kinase domain-containing protein [Rhodopirellula sp. JC639]|uniref:protein kinase domain-containing protein n=1 Tax=Stieleria mannarensis TaxID=2755585 RepID=UPI001601C075|nr:protein kinase [Rhodopirellula sp. JC639]
MIIPAKLAGRSVKCSACQHVFEIQAVRTPSQQSIESGLQVDAPAGFSEAVKQSASTQSSERSEERDDDKVADTKRPAKKHSATPEPPAVKHSTSRDSVSDANATSRERQGHAATKRPVVAQQTNAPSSTANADTREKSNSTDMTVENETTSTPQSKKAAAADDALTDSAIPAERPSKHSVPNGKKTTAVKEGGTAIGRFKIEEILGSGGFGDVYRAYDPLLDRHAALKVLRAKSTTEERRERMLREAKASARLRHPNIVAVYEVGENKERSFIASQFIPGTTLADHLKQIDHSSPDPETLRAFVVWLIELSRALAYAHRESIIHRDVKPHNVLIDEDSHAQLTDFGLAHQIVADADTTRQLVGTPAYMSPEQVEGDLSKISPASDQYAVSVILFEGLVGRRPFEGDSISLLSSIVHDEVPKPTDLNSTVPLPLEQICLKAMSRDASNRYADCDELADDLQRWLDGELVKAGNPTWIDHSLHWAKKRPHLAGWLAALAATFLMLGGTTITLGLVKLNSAATELTASREELGQSKMELKEVRLESEQKGRELESRIVREKTFEYARKFDGGTRVIEANDLAMIHRMLDRVPWKDRGIEHSLFRRRVIGTPIILHAGEPIRHLSWSHDGTLLAAVTERGDIRFWDGIHHTPLTVAKVDNIITAEFHPSRLELISLHNREYDRKTRKSTKAIVRKWLVVRDADQVRLSRSTESESDINNFRSLAFHPSGSLFAVCGDGRVEIRDMQNGLGIKSARNNINGDVLDVAYSADGKRLECLVQNFLDIRRLIIDEDHPEGHEAWAYSPRTPPLAMDPSVVTVQPPRAPIDRANPNTTYFRGKVLSIFEDPVNSGSPGQLTCAIELTAGYYFRGYSDGHVMEGSISRVGHLAEISAAASRPDLACVATGDRSGEIRIWPTTSRTPEGARCVLANGGGPKDDRLVSNFDGTLLSTHNDGSAVTVWQTDDGKVAFELDGHALGTHAVDFHPERNEVLTVDGEGVCRIWDLVPSNRETRVLRSWRVESGVPSYVCFDPSGENILMFGRRFFETEDDVAVGFAMIVSAAEGTIVRELQGLPGFPIAGVFVPDSDSVIVSCDDKTIASYSRLTGERIADFETDDLVAIDLDVTADQLVAVLAEPCALLSNGDGRSSYRSHLRSWQIETGTKMFDVSEFGVSYRFVDVDATLGRILAPAGDGYRIHDLATGERLWTDYRYPASYQVNETREETYTVQVPYIEQIEQSYTVQVPYTEEIQQTYTVSVPVMKTEVLKGTRSPDEPDTIAGALVKTDQSRLDAILEGKIRRTKNNLGISLVSDHQLEEGVFLKSDERGSIQLFSDQSLTKQVRLAPVEAEETAVAMEVVITVQVDEERSRIVPCTKYRTEERTRTVAVTKCRLETRTRTVPVAKVIPMATAKGKAIFLPSGRGLALAQFDAAYVVSAAIPSSPRELVASDCHYEMLATDAAGKLVAAAGQSGSCGACGCNDIDIWHTEDGQHLRTLRLSGASAGAINFDPRTGNLLVGISCFGARANANKPPDAAGRDEIAPPVPEDEAKEALAYEGATLLVIDPRSGEILEQLQGPESIIRIVTSIDRERPVVLLVDQENQVYRLNDDGVIQSQSIRSGDARSVSVSEDGQLATYNDPEGRSVVTLVSAMEKQARLPTPWTHAHLCWSGKELIAKKSAQPNDAMTIDQELTTMAWTIDRITQMLTQPRPAAELPPGTTSSDGWVLPAMDTTLVQSKGGRTPEFRPLHAHSTLKEFQSGGSMGKQVFRGGKVFSIGDPYPSRRGWPTTHNHVITWEGNGTSDSKTNVSIPLEPSPSPSPTKTAPTPTPTRSRMVSEGASAKVGQSKARRTASPDGTEKEISSRLERHSLIDYLPDNLEECLVKGAADRTENGAIALHGPDPESFLEIPAVLPEAYRMELMVRRESTGGTFVVCVPHRGFPACCIIDGNGGSGISDIDGKSYAYNSTNVRKRQFQNGQTHSIQIISSPDGILINWDGKRLYEFNGAPDRLSLQSYSWHPNRLFPAVKAANGGHFVVEKTIVQTDGLDAPKPAVPPYPQSDASIALAEERFGPALRDVRDLAEKLGGFITFESAYTGGQRLRLNTQSRKGSRKWVSVAGVDFSPLAKVSGPVKISAPATTNWTQAILPKFDAGFRLEILDLSQAQDVTASVLRKFPLEHVAWLSLHRANGLRHMRLGDDASESIAQMKSLNVADLRGVRIELKNATALASLSKLEVLKINSNLASDASIEKLSASQSIQVLEITNESEDSTVLSDAALTSLEKMTELRELKLEKTGVSQNAVDRYRQSKPLVKLSFTAAEVNASVQ